jgi:transposase
VRVTAAEVQASLKIEPNGRPLCASGANRVAGCSARGPSAGARGWEYRGFTAAVWFTILAGAKRDRLEPWAYHRDVLLRLSAGATDLESLLPDCWAARHPKHGLQYRLDESRRKATRQKAARQTRRAIAGPKA